MAFILFFGTVILLASLIRNKLLLHMIIVACAIFMSQRGLDTPDTAAYQTWFEKPPILNPNVEQGYAWLCYYAGSADLSFRLFLFIIAFLEMEIWLLCTCKLFPKANYNLMFALCLAFYGIYFWGCVLRASIAITLGYFAMCGYLTFNINRLKKYIYFYAIILIASTIHISSLIYIFCPYLNFRLQKKQAITIVACSVIGVFMLNSFGVTTYINSVSETVDGMSKFTNYTNHETEESIISLFWVISLVLCCWVISRYKFLVGTSKYEMITQFFCNLYFIGFILITITNKIPAGTRLGMMYTFFEFIIIYKLANTYKPQIGRIAIYSGYILLRFSYMIHSFPLFLNY